MCVDVRIGGGGGGGGERQRDRESPWGVELDKPRVLGVFPGELVGIQALDTCWGFGVRG